MGTPYHSRVSGSMVQICSLSSVSRLCNLVDRENNKEPRQIVLNWRGSSTVMLIILNLVRILLDPHESQAISGE